MSFKNKEQNLIKQIKTIPIVIIIIFSLVTTYILINSSINEHTKHLKNTKDSFIQKQKESVKNETLRVVKHIKYQKNLAEKKLKANLKHKIREIHKRILIIYNRNIDKSKKEIIKLIKENVRPIRFFNGRGYFFIDTIKGIKVMHPILPHLEGKNIISLKDKKGTYLVKNFLNVKNLKDQEGFTSYYWTKPNNEKESFKKISFSKYIEPLDLVITTGEYLSDFEDNIKKELTEEIQNIRFGKNGYIFMHQYDGLCLTHIKEENIGKYRLGIKDKKGNLVLKDIIDFAKQGEGFIEYIGTINPITGLPAKKISYIVGLDNWKWQIGAGTYISDIDVVLQKTDKDFKEKLKDTIFKIVIISILLTVILILTLHKFTNRIQLQFNEYKSSLDKANENLQIKVDEEVEKNSQQQLLMIHQSRLAQMGEMISMIAHQWRQPLNALSVINQTVSHKHKKGKLDDEFIANFTEKSNNYIQGMSETINDFKNFFKPEKEKVNFNINEVILNIIDMLNPTFSKHNICIDFKNDKSIYIDGFPNELGQAFINIINNSKDALIDNDIKDKKLSIDLTQINNITTIKIIDNAGGIPKNVIPNIFDPYFSTKEEKNGTGIGLYMTKLIIEEHMNGKINVLNINGGVTFKIIFKGDI